MNTDPQTFIYLLSNIRSLRKLINTIIIIIIIVMYMQKDSLFRVEK